MLWPRTPVERLQHFSPRFCPRPACPEHRRFASGYRFRHHGSYLSRARLVPRFRCLACGRTFSQKTFALSYYLKRPELLRPVAAGLQAGSAHRQLARTLGCAPSTVTRLSARLGRHAILLMSRALSHMQGRLTEPVVFDHFESFEFSQNLPFGVATPVGRESWFVYGLDPAPHARTGRRSLLQEPRRRRSRRSCHGGYAGSSIRTVAMLVSLCPKDQPLHLVGDGHPAYQHAASRPENRGRVLLQSFPNPRRGPKGSPRSPEALARDRALFPVDALHTLIRHTVAHHRRETIAFGRRLNALMERLFLTMVWRNFVKGRSERRPDPVTPAMRVGLANGPWSWKRVFSHRLFPARESLPGCWGELYRRDWTTPVLTNNTRHRLAHAY